ncbi:hypothetical protein E2C01_039181 [Portunus trituberculatus]|uniref:Uncharacterized protein n=1 Tax=Portunus trituberculatus TaxID=210409 RepID=A0A5B7FE40_PORTR|nr:hypothetical protein [Portunus trituberculatus]
MPATPVTRRGGQHASFLPLFLLRAGSERVDWAGWRRNTLAVPNHAHYPPLNETPGCPLIHHPRHDA